MSQRHDALVLSRLELRGEDLYLVPEGRPVSSWLDGRGWRRLSIPLGARGRELRLKYGRTKFRLAHGYWPKEVDHRDRNRGNDLLSNLKDASRSEQAQNRRAPPRQLPRGVYKSVRGVGYYAAVRLGGKRHNLGYHPTPEAASLEVETFRAAHFTHNPPQEDLSGNP